MATQPSLSNFSVELLFAVFKHLDRPSKLSLALTSPQILQCLTKYFKLDLDRYRADPLFLPRMSVPESVSWEDPSAQGAVIRWIAMPGSDDNDGSSCDLSEKEKSTLEEEFDFVLDNDRSQVYGVSKAGMDELVVRNILGQWLRRRCGVDGGVIFCAYCYRFMRLRPENGEMGPWCAEMVTRDMWFRHCGHCDPSYSIRFGCRSDLMP